MTVQPQYDTLDVLAIGNAIVDVVSRSDDGFLETHGLNKGTMTLIDGAMAERLYEDMGPAQEISGGSGANTAVGVAALGGHAGFIGKVRNDQLGGIFRHDIRASKVEFETEPTHEGAPTARCLIFVTPDAQRTMQTYLGACTSLGPNDVDEEMVRKAKVTYLEGYLWDPEHAKEAFLKAARIAGEAGRKVSLSLSDPFCVDRHRESFRNLVTDHIDILFANEEEILSLYQTKDFDAALQAVRHNTGIAVLTRGPKGCVVVAGEEVHMVDAASVEDVMDTTGAGDLFAAGFLYGHTHGYNLHDSARIGAIAAAEAISHYGARPETDLAALVRQTLR